MYKKSADGNRELRKAFISRSILIPVVGAITVLCITVSVSSLNTYIVYDGARVSVLNSRSGYCAAALKEMGVELSSEDIVSMPEQPADGLARIHILRGKKISVRADGEVRELVLVGGTVSSALSRAEVEVSPDDIITPVPEAPLEDGTDIVVTRVTRAHAEELQDVPFRTEKRNSQKLEKGKRATAQKGRNGQKRLYFELELHDGEVAAKNLVGEEILENPVSEIIEIGTKAPAVAKEAKPTAGAPAEYKRVLDVSATAYTTERWKKKTTATGAVARVGLIAVDPRVIPLGTKLYITSADGKSWVYGTAVAADTGGSVKGNKIDLFFDTHAECIKFGVKKAKVYILE